MPKGMPRSKYPQLYGDIAPTDDTTPVAPPADSPVIELDTVEQIDIEGTEFSYALGDLGASEFLQPPVELPPGPPTPEQLRIRELENLLAQERGKKDPPPQYELPKTTSATPSAGPSTNILIHFVAEAGFTALGQVWFRGQELEFTPGSQAYRDTCDRNGRSWLELRGDDAAQIERWGEVQFRTGPWPGKSYVEAATARFEQLRSMKDDGSYVPAPSEAELTAAAAAETGRRRAAPRLLPVR